MNFFNFSKYFLVLAAFLAGAASAQLTEVDQSPDVLDQVVPAADDQLDADSLPGDDSARLTEMDQSPDVLDQVVHAADDQLDADSLPGDDSARLTEVDQSPDVLDQVVPVADDQIDADSQSGDESGDQLDVGPPSTGAETIPEAVEFSPEEQLIIEFERYKELMSQGIFDEADNVAKRVVDLAIRTQGPKASDTAKALTNLAIVQHRNKQYETAQQNYESAIDIIEENEDRLNEELINPLRGLGAAQLEGGRPDLAVQTYGRAVHITHVNEGPHNMAQLELLESLAETNLRLGAVKDARAIHDSIYALNIRFFKADQLEMIPSLMRRAEWQHRTGYFIDERSTYRRIIRVIETNAGKNDLRLIDPLTRLGESYFFIDLTETQPFQQATVASGEIYFKRAMRIAENHPDADWRAMTQTKLALGDYYIQQGSYSRSRSSYRDAWELLSEDDERLEIRNELMERVHQLNGGELPQYAGSAERADRSNVDEQILEGRITLSFAVTDRGRVVAVKLVEAQPEEFSDMLKFTAREVRSRVYRPRYEDGTAIGTADQTFTHRYFYRKTDLDALRAQAEHADNTNSGDQKPEAEEPTQEESGDADDAAEST